jgi:hypothetical protein
MLVKNAASLVKNAMKKPGFELSADIGEGF